MAIGSPTRHTVLNINDPVSEAPAAGSRDIVCFSSIDWDFIWQGHQEIMRTLARQGNRVLYVENTGVRAPQMRDLPRIWQRLRNWWRGAKGFRQEEDGLFVYSPLVLPFPYSRPARFLNRISLSRGLQRWMRAVGFERPVVWTFLPTPLIRDLIAELDPLLSVYYCIDDLASSSHAARRIRQSEDRLLAEADLVFVTSEKLRARAATHSNHVHMFPFGVSYRKFADVRDGSAPLPADLDAIPAPRCVYVGGLHQWVDQDLILAAAERLPGVNFVLVGPEQVDVSRLRGRRNIHLLGPRPHDEVPRYLKGCTVGLVPYRLSEYTTHVHPTKLSEYMAMGLPVVATDLPEIRRFNARHGDVVAVGVDAAGFSARIEDGIADDGYPARQARIEAAHANSWERAIPAMSSLMSEALVRRKAAGRSWQETLRRLYRKPRRRLLAAATALVLIYVLPFETPLVWWLASPLRVADAPVPADAIVVFAGGVGESGRAGGGYQERVEQAVSLYERGFAKRLIFSSGFVLTFREAAVMKDLAVAHGVPADAVLVEEKAASTYENVILVREILAREHLRSALLISSPYHMQRALLVWRRQMPQVGVTPTPVAYSQFYAHRRGASVEQIRGIVHEYAAIVAYWWRGWL